MERKRDRNNSELERNDNLREKKNTNLEFGRDNERNNLELGRDNDRNQKYEFGRDFDRSLEISREKERRNLEFSNDLKKDSERNRK